MTQQIKNAIDHLNNGSPVDFKREIESVLSQKISDRLEIEKAMVASDWLNGDGADDESINDFDTIEDDSVKEDEVDFEEDENEKL